MADRPATDAHHARATSSDGALPRVSPSTSSTVSQPRTMAGSPVELAGDGPGLPLGEDLRRPRRSGPTTSSSSTPLTITSGAKPASRSTRRRTGDAEASTSRRVTPPAWSRAARSCQTRRAGSLRRMDRPPPDPAKLLADWMEWEKGETPPGKVISNLKTHGLRDLLETLRAAQGADASA